MGCCIVNSNVDMTELARIAEQMGIVQSAGEILHVAQILLPISQQSTFVRFLQLGLEHQRFPFRPKAPVGGG